jgi:hypothetical protein
MHILDLFNPGPRVIKGSLFGNEEEAKGRWRGQEGERHEFILKHTAAIPLFEGYYVAIYKFEDEEGNSLINFAGRQLDWLVVGESYRIRATVKKTTVYQGVRQTHINRLKNMGTMPRPVEGMEGLSLEEQFAAL